MQESGERDHQTEDALHEQQGRAEENASRRRQRVPGVRLRWSGVERNPRHTAPDGGGTLRPDCRRADGGHGAFELERLL